METKRVAIGDLEGAALDWAVAVAAGETLSEDAIQDEWILVGAGTDSDLQRMFQPTTDWSQCGPLIELYKVTVYEEPGSGFVAGLYPWAKQSGVITMDYEVQGGTYLIAACRAIVASHNPDGYVDVPVELLP